MQGRLGGNSRDLPDRRMPGEVLDAMRRDTRGVHQLAQALRDFKEDIAVRAVDENGTVLRRADGTGDQVVTDVFLRDQYPPHGKGRTKRPGATPTEVLHNRFVEFG
ncbi:MAG: hypothetical protein K2V38_17395, partial [Gemmataceae bacterium]|nr:hypothetical protein [Gemmataceae bacterium]